MGFWILFLLIRFYSSLENPFHALFAWFSLQGIPDRPLNEKITIWIGFAKSLFVGLWTLLLAWRGGRKIRFFFHRFEKSYPMEAFLDLALGFLMLNCFWMGLGLTGLWFPGLWALLTLPAGLWVIWDLHPLWKNLPPIRLSQLKGKAGIGILFLLSLVYTGILFAHDLLPETFYDALNYFLGMPQAWLNRHGICDLPTQMLSGYFHGGSLFFMNALIAGDTGAAKTLNALVLVLCVGLVWKWMEEWGEKEGALFAAFWTLTFPLFFINSWAVRVDGLVTFLTLLVFYSLSRLWPSGEMAAKGAREAYWVFMACALGGAAIAVKPTALVGLAAVSLLLLWDKGPIWFFRPKHWVFAGVCFLVFAGPWLLKNWVYAGNPLFPYASSLFGGRSLTPDHYARLLGENHQFLPMDHGLFSYLTLPWRLTMPQEGETQFLGPLILAFLPLLFLLKHLDGRWKRLAWLTALYLILGLCSTHMLRFLMPGFLMLFVLVGKAVAHSGEMVKKTAWAALGLSAVLNLGSYAVLSSRYFDGAGVWSGRETPEAYLDRKMINSYEPLARWCDFLPSESKVLVVGDARGQYYPRPFLANSAFDMPFFEEAAKEEKSPQGILKRLKEAGIDAVVLNLPEGMRLSQQYGLYHLTPDQWKKLDLFFKEGLKPVFIRPTLQAYLVGDSLGAPDLKAPFDPFTFFDAATFEFTEALQAGDLKKAEGLRLEVFNLFPRDAYWREQLARLDEAEGVPQQALKDYKQADQLGFLSPNGYESWKTLSRKWGRGRDLALITKREKAWASQKQTAGAQP